MNSQLSPKIRYSLIGLFFLVIAIIAAWGLSSVPQQAKRNACLKVQEEVCDFMVACELVEYDRVECAKTFDADAFCTQVITSSVEEINQCATDVDALISCKEQLPESCYNLR